jgi:hypothetical protein
VCDLRLTPRLGLSHVPSQAGNETSEAFETLFVPFPCTNSPYATPYFILLLNPNFRRVSRSHRDSLPTSVFEAYAEAHDPRPRPVGSDPYKAERQSVHAPPARFPQVPPRPGTGPPGRGRHVESWSWRIGRCGHSPRRATQCASKFKPSHQTEILTPLSVRMRRRGVYTPLHVYYASPQAGSL